MSGTETKQSLLEKSQPAPPKGPPRPEVTVQKKEKPAEKKGNNEVFAILEKRDEEQIARQLQGELVQEMFYSFKLGDREVTGLSWVGIKECARHMGNVKLDLLSIIDKEDQYQVVVKATDTLRNLDSIGVSTQAKVDRYSSKPDDFALQKAMSKAQRNAIRSLLPEKTIAAMLKRFKENRLR